MALSFAFSPLISTNATDKPGLISGNYVIKKSVWVSEVGNTSKNVSFDSFKVKNSSSRNNPSPSNQDMDQPPLPIGDDNYDALSNLVLGYDPLVPYPTTAGPALEVFSVTIFNPNQSDSRIYGDITSVDYTKTLYYFYKCPNKPELIKPGWNDLVLFECPIAPIMGGNVKFRLKNYSQGVPIFNKVYDMNKAIERDDGTFFLQGDGNSGYRFEMIFTKNPFSIIAKVNMFFELTSPPPSAGDTKYPLHGTITTNKFTCFETAINEPLWLDYGVQDILPTRRKMYAVSIDSTLDVKVELYNRTLCITKDKCEIEATQYTRLPEPEEYYFDSTLDGYELAVQVQWIFHRELFWCIMEGVSSPYDVVMGKFPEPRIPGALVEVYSVFSCRGNSSALRGDDLYGHIIVCNGDEIFNILARNSKRPGDDLLPNDEEQRFKTLSLEWPDGKWVVGEKFKLYLKLKDVNGFMVRVGVISWRPDMDSRYDCRLCDTFSGDEGYFAAVHYSVFKHGKKAKVFVECRNGPFSIYGSIFAQYNNYDCFYL